MNNARLRLIALGLDRGGRSSSSSSSQDDFDEEPPLFGRHVEIESSSSSSSNLSIPYGAADDDEGEDESSSEADGNGDDDDEESQLSSVTFEPPPQQIFVHIQQQPNSHDATGETELTLLTNRLSILTPTTILEAGLAYAGFSLERQERNNNTRKVLWFKSFYGVEPTTILPFFLDIKAEFPDISYKDCLMTMNWLFLYDTYPVLSGRWKYCEEYIGAKVIEYGKKMAVIGRSKIDFKLKHDVKIGRTVDCSTFMVYEMRLDPSSKWFDWKTHSCGLKYEFCLAIYEARVLSVRGPAYPSTHDITVFRGGKKEENKEDWDQSALYFQLKDGDKCVADSGYAGEPEKIVMTQDEHSKDFKEFLARCKNRQETFHWRLKAFNILGGRFRHGTSVENRMELHRMAVDVIVGVIQYDYENGHPPFDVV